MKAYERLWEPSPGLYDPRRSSRYKGRQPTSRILDIARCPLCRFPLVARMVRGGPKFLCSCRPQTRKQRGMAGADQLQLNK